jgi:uncharacterized Zn-binding protein involved in type VI secretion
MMMDTPQTQKAKGIATLQQAGHLSQQYAKVALTLQQALLHFSSLSGGKVFARPCPITPRHGFVDSREVKTTKDVETIWAETKAADPQGELILMPFIPASHSIVWRPGLLSVGPGHDGATAGHDSISVFLQRDYAQSWASLAVKAGVDLTKGDPFIEAVSGQGQSTVLTQVRGGVKGTPTEPDWVPVPMVVGKVVMLDPAAKEDSGAMLAWETDVKKLDPVTTIVYNPGGNMGDHWSVHAQIAKVAVATTFLPVVGQSLPKMGQDPVPMDAQAVIFGYLGGLLGPSLLPTLNRSRAAACAILGSHHGLRMGKDAGQFLGTSVAMMLRLGQAAVWGEARHKGPSPKPDRQQVFSQILDDYIKGRKGFKAKARLFWECTWAGGYGGKNWGACAEALMDLENHMLALIHGQAGVTPETVVGQLTRVVNLAHNNGWWLDKFTTKATFDQAAQGDPRVAIEAGPIWYDATLVSVASRAKLFDWLRSAGPMDFSDIKGFKAGAIIGKAAPKVFVALTDGNSTEAVSGVSQATGSTYYSKPAYAGYCKQNTLPAVTMHGNVNPGFMVTEAQTKVLTNGHLHLQLAGANKQYVSGTVTKVRKTALAAITALPQGDSFAGTSSQYYKLTVTKASDTAVVVMAGQELILVAEVK